jgi:hypothetical protein
VKRRCLSGPQISMAMANNQLSLITRSRAATLGRVSVRYPLVNCRKGRPFCIPTASRLNKNVEETFETGRDQMRN